MFIKKIFTIISVTVVLLFCNAYAEDSGIEGSFKDFCKKWMEAKDEQARKHFSCKKLKKKFVSEYTGYTKDYDICIKATGSELCPYIGLLKYKEIRYKNGAQTFKGAQSGPSKSVFEYPVTEIFRYSNGEWQY